MNGLCLCLLIYYSQSYLLTFPTVYPCPEIGKLSSALITLFLVWPILPKYVVLKSILSSKPWSLGIFLTEYLHIYQNMLLLLYFLQISFPVFDFLVSPKALKSLPCFFSSNGLMVNFGVSFILESTYLILSLKIDQLIICSILFSSLILTFVMAF